MDPNKDDPVRNCEFPGGHSNILKSADSRILKSLQRCDKNEGRRCETKPLHTNQLVRFTARTPCVHASPVRGILHFDYFLVTIIQNDKIENVVKTIGRSTILRREAGEAQRQVLAPHAFPGK